MAARVLVIENNPANLDLMMYLLDAFGYRPVSARDGQEGVEMAVKQNPDLILCDIDMPNMSGYEVARSLKHHPHCRCIPTVAVTALAMVGDRDRILRAGFDGYLSKPINPEVFVRQIEQFVNTAA